MIKNKKAKRALYGKIFKDKEHFMRLNMKKSKKDINKRIKIIDRISIILYVLAFLMVIITITLDDKYPESSWLLVGTIVFIVFNGSAFLLRNSIKTEKLEIEAKQKRDLYQEIQISEFYSLDNKTIIETLEKQKFVLLSNDYYHKKSRNHNLSFYAKFVKFPSLDGFLAKEILRFKKLHERNKNNICGLLFVDMEKVNKEDLDLVTQVSRDFLLMEATKIYYRPISVIVILNDISTQKTYYLSSPDLKDISIYTLGIVVLNKIYNHKKK
jgi:hypothetical protein